VEAEWQINDQSPKRDTMSIEEVTVSNMWEIAAIVEVLEHKSILEQPVAQFDYFSPIPRHSLSP
jgi:hypothetical protein